MDSNKHSQTIIAFNEVNSPLLAAFADELEAHDQLKLARTKSDFTEILETGGERLIVFFDIPIIDESILLASKPKGPVDFSVVDEVFSSVSDFMESLHNLVTNATARFHSIEVFVLAFDDVACRLLGLPQMAIQNQSRLSCLKSLTKEYARSGCSFNMLVLHPSSDLIKKDQKKNIREKMKPFALRYKATDPDVLKNFILSACINTKFPSSGSAIYLGLGTMEFGS